MNLESFYHDAVNGVLASILVFGSYHFSKFYVAYDRKDNQDASIKRERIANYIYCVFSVLVLGAAAAFIFGRNYSLIPKVFFTAIIPSLFGMAKGYERDARLTPEERKKVKYDMEKDNTDSSGWGVF